MKKSFIFILFSILLILSLIGCNKSPTQNQGQSQSQSQSKGQSSSQATNTPEQAVSDFLTAMQHQQYTGVSKYYAENLDNMANFRNQIETISPTIANKFFSKLAEFTYTIEHSSVDSKDPSKATVFVTINYYDVGQAFEKTLLEYIKDDISMTYDGKKDDDIIKKADETIVENINSSKQTTANHVPILLSLDDNKWKVNKLSENTELSNILSGNILETINTITSSN